jgi:hypothetical protein
MNVNFIKIQFIPQSKQIPSGLYIQLMLDAEIITVCSETTTAHQ